MYRIVSMILKYSNLILPYTQIPQKKLLVLSKLVEVAIDTIASGHQLSRHINKIDVSLLYTMYIPISRSVVCVIILKTFGVIDKKGFSV